MSDGVRLSLNLWGLSPKAMTADCRKMEETSDDVERKNEKLTAQLARQTARAEKVPMVSGWSEVNQEVVMILKEKLLNGSCSIDMFKMCILYN